MNVNNLRVVSLSSKVNDIFRSFISFKETNYAIDMSCHGGSVAREG